MMFFFNFYRNMKTCHKNGTKPRQKYDKMIMNNLNARLNYSKS